MKIIQVKHKTGSYKSRWVTSEAAAGTARSAMTKEGAKRDDLATISHDITPTKTGIVEFLNKVCALRVKAAESEQLRQDVEAFLARGGKIQHLVMGAVSQQPTAARRSVPISNKQKQTA